MTGKNKIAAALLLSLTLLTAGCSDASFGTDSMLRPPRATGDKAEIQDIITKEAGGSYTLKYPQAGDYRSAIIMRNENTKNEYAIALYATEKDTKLNTSVITYRDNTWECAGTFTNTGAGIDRVLFKDINGDKNEEIIIGWTAYNSARKTLTAYSITTEGAYEMKVDETYDELVVADVLNDHTDDLLLLSLSTQEAPSTATLLQYSEEKKRPIGKYSLELDPAVTSFTGILVDKVAVNTKGDGVKNTATGAPSQTGQSSSTKQESGKQESGKQEASKPTSSKPEASKPTSSKPEASKPASSKPEASKPTSSKPETSKEESSKEESSKEEVSKPAPKPAKATELNANGVVLECSRIDNTLCTQMIYYDVELDELVNPLMVKSGTDAYTNPTVRTDAVYSRDVNGDGVIDIPVVSQMMAEPDEASANVCSLTSWQNYDAGQRKMKTVMKTVVNLKDGYYFILPERWSGNVTARSDVETRELTFYLWNSKTSSAGDKLLTICRFTEQQWEEADKKGLIRLEGEAAGGKAVFGARVFETSARDELNIREQEVKDNFQTL